MCIAITTKKTACKKPNFQNFSYCKLHVPRQALIDEIRVREGLPEVEPISEESLETYINSHVIVPEVPEPYVEPIIEPIVEEEKDDHIPLSTLYNINVVACKSSVIPLDVMNRIAKNVESGVRNTLKPRQKQGSKRFIFDRKLYTAVDMYVFKAYCHPDDFKEGKARSFKHSESGQYLQVTIKNGNTLVDGVYQVDPNKLRIDMYVGKNITKKTVIDKALGNKTTWRFLCRKMIIKDDDTYTYKRCMREIKADYMDKDITI